MKPIIAWARQPTSVAGFATILATLSAMLLQQITTTQAIPLLVGALASIILPDNAGAKSAAAALAAGVVSELHAQTGKSE